MNDRIFAFDIDGTLIDADGNLKPYVKELFLGINKESPDAQFMFVSGAHLSKIKKAIATIEKETNLKIKNPYIIAQKGAQIFDKNGKYFCEPTFISQEICTEMEKLVYFCEKYAYIGYATDEGNFFIDKRSVTKDKNWLSSQEIMDFAYKIAKFDIQPAEKERIEKLQKEKKVRAVWVLVNDVDKNRALHQKLNYWALDYPGLSVAGDFDLCMSIGNKAKAVKTLCGDRIKDVVYFGDGDNDLELLSLKESGVIKGSVGVGKRSAVLESAELALPELNRFAIDYALGNLDKKICSCIIKNEDKTQMFVSTPNTYKQTLKDIKYYSLNNAHKKEKQVESFLEL